MISTVELIKTAEMLKDIEKNAPIDAILPLKGAIKIVERLIKTSIKNEKPLIDFMDTHETKKETTVITLEKN